MYSLEKKYLCLSFSMSQRRDTQHSLLSYSTSQTSQLTQLAVTRKLQHLPDMFPTTKTITISLQLSCACLLCTDKMGPTTTPRVYLYHSSNVPGYVILHYPSKARLSCHASTLFCAVTCLQFNNHIFIFKTLYCKFLFTQTTYIEVRKQKIGLN